MASVVMNREPDDEVAYFIRVGTICYQLQCLPGPGGVLQQDGYIMMGVSATLDALVEKQNKDEAHRASQVQNSR